VKKPVPPGQNALLHGRNAPDSGIRAEAFPLLEKDSLHRVITETKRLGAKVMINTLKQIREHGIRSRPLDMAEAQYHTFPKASDVRLFRAEGHRLL